MKKIVLSLFVILLTSTLSVGSTIAVYGDVEQSLNNDITSGTLDLEINGENPFTSAIPFTFSNAKPGDGISTPMEDGQFNVKNVGTTPIHSFQISVTDLKNFENNCDEPEVEAADTTCTAADDQGELGQRITLRFSTVANCTSNFSGSILNNITSTPVDFTSKIPGGVINPGQTVVLHICHSLTGGSPGVGNNYMGDSAQFNLSFIGQQ